MNDDERLEKDFANLREADKRRAPPFEAMWRAPARKRSAWIVALPVATVGLAAAAALLLWIDVGRDEAAPTSAAPAPAVVAAVAPMPVLAIEPTPLDFLLNVPGHASLSTTPDFDRSLLQGRRR